MDLQKAKEGWKIFHQKENPREIVDVNVDWPPMWELAGIGVTLYYSSDKWYPDGEFVNYYHDHKKGQIKIYHPVGVVRGGDYRDFKPVKPPVRRWPDSGFVLGDCLGWDLIETKSSQNIYRAVPHEGTILCAFPNCRQLFAFYEPQGVVALFAGPGMVVQDVGIVG